MALMLGKLYDALTRAGASPEDARAAAEEVAGYENRLGRLERDLGVLKWMVGVLIALTLGVFWMQWQTIDRLAGMAGRLAIIEARLPTS